MTVLTISSKGWVVIPAALRKKYHLKPGTRVRIVDYGGVLSILPELDDAIERTAGMLKAKGKKPLTQTLIAEHAKERIRDRKR